MKVYRIVQNKVRTNDLTGTGAFKWGGRWNSKGTYMLYTAENSSLAYLENLVYVDKSLLPLHLYIMEIEITDPSLIYTFPDSNYPKDWSKVGLIKNKILGDQWMTEKKFLGIRVRSAINTSEFNVLLNPLFPHYNTFVIVKSIKEIAFDDRLVT